MMLSSGCWVDSLTLALNGGGLQFTARIFELRQRGIAIEAERNPDSPKNANWWHYRLCANPGQLSLQID
jgi:hypothetical protein